ncbi:hypothetical protein GQX74_002429 [Glossina fuscipes]|nr:hypothetical protein GQX74_002429 [Glossina fuscipes]
MPVVYEKLYRLSDYHGLVRRLAFLAAAEPDEKCRSLSFVYCTNKNIQEYVFLFEFHTLAVRVPFNLFFLLVVSTFQKNVARINRKHIKFPTMACYQ